MPIRSATPKDAAGARPSTLHGGKTPAGSAPAALAPTQRHSQNSTPATSALRALIYRQERRTVCDIFRHSGFYLHGCISRTGLISRSADAHPWPSPKAGDERMVGFFFDFLNMPSATCPWSYLLWPDAPFARVNALSISRCKSRHLLPPSVRLASALRVSSIDHNDESQNTWARR